MPRQELLQSIANTIRDYREGELPAPTPDRVERWVEQFEPAVQNGILAELNHTLSISYINCETVETFIRNLVTNERIAGQNACRFWNGVKFLDIQGGGNSQHELLQMFDRILQGVCQLSINECGTDPSAFMYLDDGVFSGNRVLSDLKAWVRDTAPNVATVHIVVIALHRGGQYYITNRLGKFSRELGKAITLHWWRVAELEDRRAYTNNSDVLRPTQIPDDQDTAAYFRNFNHPLVLRQPGQLGEMGFFSSENGRHLLEQEFLKAGVRIRNQNPNLIPYMRPLGNSVLETPGFGSLLVTFRNCPNNCPLVFWAEGNWYPLFPRRAN